MLERELERLRLIRLASGLIMLACSESPQSLSAGSGEAVSFQRDLLPKFATACGLSDSCHALRTGQRVYLGCQATSSSCTDRSPDIAVHDHLLERSAQLPSMPYVAPGDPSNSYLQHKIDGELSGLNCSGVGDAPCGESMPPGQPASPVFRAQLRAWILAGALQN